MPRIQLALVVALTCIAASGCRASASSIGMTPEPLTFRVTHSETLWLEVTTPVRFLSISPARVPRKAVEDALRTALADSRIFRHASTSETADFNLRVAFSSIEEQEASLEMTARAVANWVLTEGDDTTPVWRKTITSEHRATSDDTSFVAERGRMALEGAVRNNLIDGLEAIGRLSL